jgi:putative SOS response-associated peptidase YedK
MVMLERSDWSAWLEETGNEGELLRPLPVGALQVEQVRS